MLMFIYKNVNAAFDYLTISMSFFFVQAAVLAVKAMVGDPMQSGAAMVMAVRTPYRCCHQHHRSCCLTRAVLT
jgi:hypothetical protein